MNKRFFLLCFIFTFNTRTMTDPYTFLGIGRHATSKEIEKRCRALRGRYHPDKNNGKILRAYLDINNACDEINQQRVKQETKKEDFTYTSYSNNKYSENSQKDLYEEIYEQIYKIKNLMREQAKRDGCTSKNQTCTCFATKWPGTCLEDSLFEELYCSCEPPKTSENQKTSDWYTAKTDANRGEANDEKKSSSESFQDDDFFDDFSDDFFERKSSSFHSPRAEDLVDCFILSRTIDSPIYNLGLEQALIPNLREDQWVQFVGSYIPFIQANQTAFGKRLNKFEAGVIFRSYLGLGPWQIDVMSLLSSIQVNFFEDRRLKLSYSSFDFRDFLIAVGRCQQWGPVTFTLRGLVGGSFNRIRKELEQELTKKEPLVDLPHLVAGLECYTSTNLKQTDCTNHDLITNVRWLHFFNNTIKINSRKQDGHFISDNSLTSHPGSFIDILLGLDNQLGDNNQHHIEFGYNPTFNIAQHYEAEDFLFELTSPRDHTMRLRLHHLQQPAVQHKLYAYYRYDFTLRESPGSLNIGYSKAFASGSHANVLEPGAGLFWVALTQTF